MYIYTSFIRRYSSILIIFLSASISIFSQDKQNISSQHKEVIEDALIRANKSFNQVSTAYSFSSEFFFMKQVNVTEDQMNIEADAANEPSIAFDVTNPNNMAIGWRQFDNILSNFRQAGYGVTIDGGETWYSLGPIDPGVFRSDPVLDSDAEGNFYYNSLTTDFQGDYWCDVYKSTNGGIDWGKAVEAQGGDKQWMVVDKTTGIGRGNIYAYWNASYSHCENMSFTRSTDGGMSFEDCVAIPDNPYWGTLAVDGNSDLYLVGYNNNDFVVVKSTTAKYSDSVVTFLDPVVVDMNGHPPYREGPNPEGITGQMYIATDTSGGPYAGNIYVLATIQDEATGDPADIHVAPSTDGGATWLPAVKVNDDSDNTNWQWFGDMSVAPDGRIDVVWLDTRNATSGYESELFYSFSYDGGQTWYENIRLSEAFDPHVGWPQQNKMGDYFDMVSDEEGVHLAWAGTFNGEQDVYYGRIYTNIITGIEEKKNELPTGFALQQNYPNPFNPSTSIKYQVANTENVVLKVFDPLGREVETLISQNQQPGTYEVTFDAGGLSSGVYYYKLTAGNFVQTKKMMLIK